MYFFLVTKNNRRVPILAITQADKYKFIAIDGVLEDKEFCSKVIVDNNNFEEVLIDIENSDYQITQKIVDNRTYLLLGREKISEDYFNGLIPTELTEKELLSILNNRKKEIVEETKLMLQEYLETHPLESTARGGVLGIYTVTKEKQDQMNRELSNYLELSKINPDEAKLMWNEAGKEAVEWTEVEFRQLMLEIQNYVRTLVSKQQQLEVMINACATIEEVESIKLSYE